MPIALFSLSDKTGLVEVATALRSIDKDWDFCGSKGTAAKLQREGIGATDVAKLVGEPFPDDLVVTLSPLHFGLLCDWNRPDHIQALTDACLPYIDLVWVSLYDLHGAIASNGDEAAVQKATDMGGVALLRSAAKGRRLVAGDLETMGRIVQWLREGRPDELRFRRYLAWIAERQASSYCDASSLHMRRLNVGYVPPRRLADLSTIVE